MQLIIGVDGLCQLNVSLKFQNSGNLLLTVNSASDNESRKEAFLSLFDFSTVAYPNNIHELKMLLWKYNDIFSTNEFDLGKTESVSHKIETKDCIPIHSKQYRLPHSLKEVASKYIQDMLKQGIIEPANSPWCSPFMLVKKKDGSHRFVIDYRKLNDKTVKDRWPIPNIEELIDNLSMSATFSTLDLTSGYWQVPMAESSKQKTAFSFLNNQFQFKVMPFGLSNAPATFQRLMMSVTQDLPITPYLDDIIVPTSSVQENLRLLETIFSKIRTCKFKLKPKKC